MLKETKTGLKTVRNRHKQALDNLNQPTKTGNKLEKLRSIITKQKNDLIRTQKETDELQK